MNKFWETIVEFFKQSGIAGFFANGGWLNLIMIVVACVLIYLAIKKEFEPYLLLPIAFGMLLVNLPGAAQEIFNKGATEYNAISLASAIGITQTQAEYIFTQLGVNSATTKQLNDLVMSSNFLNEQAIALGFNSKIVSDIQHLYRFNEPLR